MPASDHLTEFAAVKDRNYSEELRATDCHLAKRKRFPSPPPLASSSSRISTKSRIIPGSPRRESLSPSKRQKTRNTLDTGSSFLSTPRGNHYTGIQDEAFIWPIQGSGNHEHFPVGMSAQLSFDAAQEDGTFLKPERSPPGPISTAVVMGISGTISADDSFSTTILDDTLITRSPESLGSLDVQGPADVPSDSEKGFDSVASTVLLTSDDDEHESRFQENSSSLSSEGQCMSIDTLDSSIQRDDSVISQYQAFIWPIQGLGNQEHFPVGMSAQLGLDAAQEGETFLKPEHSPPGPISTAVMMGISGTISADDSFSTTILDDTLITRSPESLGSLRIQGSADIPGDSEKGFDSVASTLLISGDDEDESHSQENSTLIQRDSVGSQYQAFIWPIQGFGNQEHLPTEEELSECMSIDAAGHGSGGVESIPTLYSRESSRLTIEAGSGSILSENEDISTCTTLHDSGAADHNGYVPQPVHPATRTQENSLSDERGDSKNEASSDTGYDRELSLEQVDMFQAKRRTSTLSSSSRALISLKSKISSPLRHSTPRGFVSVNVYRKNKMGFYYSSDAEDDDEMTPALFPGLRRSSPGFKKRLSLSSSTATPAKDRFESSNPDDDSDNVSSFEGKEGFQEVDRSMEKMYKVFERSPSSSERNDTPALSENMEEDATSIPKEAEQHVGSEGQVGLDDDFAMANGTEASGESFMFSSLPEDPDELFAQSSAESGPPGPVHGDTSAFLEQQIMFLIEKVEDAEWKKHFTVLLKSAALGQPALLSLIYDHLRYSEPAFPHPAPTSSTRPDLPGTTSSNSSKPRRTRHRAQTTLELQRLVRMEVKLAMHGDDDLLESATAKEIRLWRKGKGEGPTLSHLRLDLDSKGTWTDWNKAAASEFVKAFVAHPEYSCYAVDEVKKVFRTHLKQLKSTYERGSRRSESDLRTLKLERMNARRRRLMERRLSALQAKMLLYPGEMSHLKEVGNYVKMEIMSADETNTDDENRFQITKFNWRSQELEDFLRHLSALHIESRYLYDKKYARGTFPVARYESDRPEPVYEGAPPDLPVNFYDQAWLNSRQHRKASLRVKPPIKLTLPGFLLRLATKFSLVKERTDAPMNDNDPRLQGFAQMKGARNLANGIGRSKLEGKKAKYVEIDEGDGDEWMGIQDEEMEDVDEEGSDEWMGIQDEEMEDVDEEGSDEWTGIQDEER